MSSTVRKPPDAATTQPLLRRVVPADEEQTTEMSHPFSETTQPPSQEDVTHPGPLPPAVLDATLAGFKDVRRSPVGTDRSAPAPAPADTDPGPPPVLEREDVLAGFRRPAHQEVEEGVLTSDGIGAARGHVPARPPVRSALPAPDHELRGVIVNATDPMPTADAPVEHPQSRIPTQPGLGRLQAVVSPEDTHLGVPSERGMRDVDTVPRHGRKALSLWILVVAIALLGIVVVGISAFVLRSRPATTVPTPAASAEPQLLAPTATASSAPQAPPETTVTPAVVAAPPVQSATAPVVLLAHSAPLPPRASAPAVPRVAPRLESTGATSSIPRTTPDPPPRTDFSRSQ